MSSDQKKPEPMEDDDNCSEFSVISVYDDQDDEDCESSQGGQILSNGARITYRDPSVHESEGFPDNVSSVSRPAETKAEENRMLTSYPDLASPSTPWNPLTLSGYVPTNSVSELMDKVLNEYTRNHELLASINSSILELKKTGKSDGEESESSSSAVSQQKLEKLYDQLTKANQKIVELETEKQSNELQFRAAAKDAELYILRLEAQLSEQCQKNKKLREELDEREDELRVSRSDVYTQRSIVKALEQENMQNEEQIRKEYNDKLRLMEEMYKKLHERNDVQNSASTQTRSPNSSTQGTQHPSSKASSISRLSAKQNYGLTCPLCQCDCPSADYYNYHMTTHANFFQCQQCNFNFDTKEDLKKHQVDAHEPKTSDFHAELTTRLANTLQTKEAPITSNVPSVPIVEEQVYTADDTDLISFVEPTKNECESPVSEFSASFVLDSPAHSIDVSDAEEALSTGFRTPAEPEEEILVVEERQVPSSVGSYSAEQYDLRSRDMLVSEDGLDEKLEQAEASFKDNASQLSEWSLHATSNKPDAVSVDDTLSILEAPTDCASSVVSVSMSSVHSSQIGASASQTGDVNQLEAYESQAEEQFVTPSQSGIVENQLVRQNEFVENQLVRQNEFVGEQVHVLEAKIQNVTGSKAKLMRNIKILLERSGYTVDDIAVANDEALRTVGSFYQSTTSPQRVEPEMKEIAYLKSYFPNLDQKTLPHYWNSADKSKYLDLSVDCLRVQLPPFECSTIGMIRSNRPIPHDCKFYYFEVTIVDKGSNGFIGVGLSEADTYLDRLPGWDAGTLGYHGDDGNFFASAGRGRSYGPTYTTGDTIGCGINFERRSIFFTKNGQYLGVAKADVDVSQLLYPTVGLQSKNAVLETNFGQREFSFNVEKNLQLFSNKPRVPVPARPLPFSQQPDQCQIFLCDCLCAFPSKGALVSHKATCSG